MRIALGLSYIMLALSLVLVALLINFPVVLLGILLQGVGGGIIWVFSMQLLMQLVPGRVQGRVFSTEFMIATLMNAIAAGGSGALLDRGISLSALMLWMAGLILLPAVLWAIWNVYGKNSPTTEDMEVGLPKNDTLNQV
jgi:MFS family permease